MHVSIRPKDILERFSRRVALKPGLSGEQIERIQKRLPEPLPSDIKELLGYSSGFDFQFGLPHAAIGTVRFTGSQSMGLPGQALPSPIDLLDDGCGNFWLVDINRTTGKWGVVFCICHDPTVVVVQAVDVSEFLLQVLEPDKNSPKDALTFVRKYAAARIWKDDPWLILARDARGSHDPVVSAFAEQLPEDSHVADLRSMEIGSGFSWDLADSSAEVERADTELVFGVRLKPPGFFERLMTGRSAHLGTTARTRD